MTLIDQNSTLLSLNSALIPGLTLIDSRDEIDRLKFLTEYASLINFYDDENKINGNWNPFLMKDPVFLLANVARLNYTKIQSLYHTTTSNLKQFINDNPTQDNISIYFNQLFNQLIEVFMKIERWSYFMNKFHHDYNLKKFIIHTLKTKFGSYFWALVALWNDIASNKSIKGIQAIDTNLFKDYSRSVWAPSKEQFWEVLNIQMPLISSKKPNGKDIQEVMNKVCNSLVLVGDQLLSFLNDIINHAATEYDSLSVREGVFPDTALLRAFVKLQGVQQQQLNSISKKHLQFYFKDILKQKKKNAKADRAFITAQLAKKNSTFELPQGTLFKAGIDANKKPILFKSLKSTNLNSGSITGGFTLTQNKNSENNLISLYKTPIASPSVLKKNKEGKLMGWQTFGGNLQESNDSVSLGFAFASPLLYLKEGTRIITIKLSFKQEINPALFTQASYYLSTQADWLELKLKSTAETATTVSNNFLEINSSTENNKEITLQITLNSTEKSIEKFIKNPDGFDVSWPMFKMVFNQFEQVKDPPVFSTIDIKVDVSNVKSFTLSNDYGILSTKKPYQLFGPTPLLNNSFIIGSEEIFSKPLSFLNVQIDWDGLPAGFQKYYQEYNNNMVLGGKKNTSSSVFKSIVSSIKKIVTKKVPKVPVDLTTPFNNTCFTSNFEVLQNKEWNAVTALKQSSCLYNDGEFVCENYVFIPPKVNVADLVNQPDQNTPEVPEIDKNQLLFGTTNQNILLDNSLFSFKIDSTIIKPDPSIQSSPLVFSEKSENGFMRMNLIGSKYGFGSDLYPEVVSNIALKNAAELMNKKSSSNLAAKLPYAPMVKLLSANYSATQSYQLDFSQSETPIQCFSYTPNSSFKVYDSTQSVDLSFEPNTTTLDGTQNDSNSLPLFPSLESNGVLYLSMDKVVAPCELNLYFELARKTGSITEKVDVNCRYLTESGWVDMPVLADGTNSFTCSGILKVGISDDISSKNPSMPNNQFWLSIGVPNDPSLYADTICLQSNGFEVERTGTYYLSELNTPKLSAGAIIKPENIIPEINKVLQPFPSFSGRGSEDDLMMSQRVSTRLKTKGRAINSLDYYSLIKQEFPDIFYSKCEYNKTNKKTQIYLVKKIEDVNTAGAFMPLVSICKEESISEFLTNKASAFANIETLNFVPEYVSITADVIVDNNVGLGSLQKEINSGLNLFLSPWIESDTVQLEIDKGLTKSELSNFIKTIKGVISVSLIQINKSTMKSLGTNSVAPEVQVQNPTQTLLVTSGTHTLNCSHLL